MYKLYYCLAFGSSLFQESSSNQFRNALYINGFNKHISATTNLNIKLIKWWCVLTFLAPSTFKHASCLPNLRKLLYFNKVHYLVSNYFFFKYKSMNEFIIPGTWTHWKSNKELETLSLITSLRNNLWTLNWYKTNLSSGCSIAKWLLTFPYGVTLSWKGRKNLRTLKFNKQFA